MTGVSALLLGISVPVALACAPPPVSASDGAPGSCDRERPWPLWEAYTKRFVTADGRASAHFEHSIAITDDGPLILTSRGDDPEGPWTLGTSPMV